MELVRFPSHGGFSVRSIFSFVLTVVVTVLLWATLSSVPISAQASNATWTDGGVVLYDGHGFNKASDITDPTGTIPSGATIYKSPVQATGSASSSKIFIIYFAPGVDPPTAKNANYAEFDYKDKKLSNPQNLRDITTTPQGTDSGLGGEVSSSCAVGGVGWIVCPVSVFLAESMDNIFNMLADFIKTQPPILGDPNNSLFTAWNIARTVANVAFVIAFLVIIYSQLTSLGISNYGLKRLIPRLIIAAVLVNISFYVSALAIDVSNILGYSVQDMFNLIREQTFHLNNDNFAGVNNNGWSTVTTVVLAGGGAIGGIYYLHAAGPAFLLTLLVGLGLLALFVLLILAARQAIIVLLVIISPLAFVAYLLPNTEKWFEKWKDLFFTMLIFFPAFSLVFGGSQLAGQLIIQNAGDNITTVLFGMAVQVAPLVVTPLILKFSGGLLGRIAQIANDPRRGLLDRTKNWQRANEELHHAKALSRRDSKNPFTRGVQVMDDRRNRRKELTDMYKLRADNRWNETKTHKGISEQMADAEETKGRIHSEHAAHIDTLKAGRGTPITKGLDLHTRAIETEEAKVSSENASAQLGAITSAYRAGVYNTLGNERLETLQKSMAENVIQTAAWKQSEQESSYLQQRSISGRMRNDKSLLDIAQGYGDPEFQVIARERAQSNAVATLTKLNKDARDNAINLLQTEAVEKGLSVKEYAIKDIFEQANSSDPDIRKKISPSRLEAALEIAIDDGQVALFDKARSSEVIDQALVDAVVARNTGTFKAKGGFHTQNYPDLSLQKYIEKFNKGEFSEDESIKTIDDVRAKFTKDLNLARLETLSNTTSANIGGMKFGAFVGMADDIVGDPKQNKQSILDLIPTDSTGKPVNDNDLAMIKGIYRSLTGALSDPSTRATMNDRESQALLMQEKIRETFFSHESPLILDDLERAMPGGNNLPKSMGDVKDIPTGDTSSTDDSPSDKK